MRLRAFLRNDHPVWLVLTIALALGFFAYAKRHVAGVVYCGLDNRGRAWVSSSLHPLEQEKTRVHEESHLRDLEGTGGCALQYVLQGGWPPAKLRTEARAHCAEVRHDRRRNVWGAWVYDQARRDLQAYPMLRVFYSQEEIGAAFDEECLEKAPPIGYGSGGGG